MSIDIDELRHEIPNAEVPDLQAAYQAIESELRRRFNARRETCEHPSDAAGYFAEERFGNIEYGCRYCLSSNRSIDDTFPAPISIDPGRIRRIVDSVLRFCQG